VTRLTDGGDAVMFESGILPGCSAMAITAVVGARNVASRFARSEDSVVAFLAAIGNDRVIHTSRFPAVGPVATVALQPQVGNVQIRWRRSRTAPGPIVAVVALGGGCSRRGQ